MRASFHLSIRACCASQYVFGASGDIIFYKNILIANFLMKASFFCIFCVILRLLDHRHIKSLSQSTWEYAYGIYELITVLDITKMSESTVPPLLIRESDVDRHESRISMRCEEVRYHSFVLLGSECTRRVDEGPTTREVCIGERQEALLETRFFRYVIQRPESITLFIV